VTNLVNPDIDESYDPNKRVFGLGFGNLGNVSFFEVYGDFSEYTPTEDELIEFVNTYFLPLVSFNHHKIDIMDAIKNVRNINFVTYCDGSKIFKKIEELLENKMKEIGYSNEEINIILSQICLAAVSGSSIDTKATTVLFGDINDRSFNFEAKLAESYHSIINHNGQFAFVIDGDGTHDFRKYMKKEEKTSSIIKMFLNKALENSAYHNDSFLPIVSEPFIMDIMNDYNQKQQSNIEYKTYMFQIDPEKNNYLYKIYHNYKKRNDKIDIRTLIEKLQLSLYDKEYNDSNTILLEVACKGDDVIAFCSHGEDYFYPYEIKLIVCSPSYRKN
jgi:hypothetical protein